MAMLFRSKWAGLAGVPAVLACASVSGQVTTVWQGPTDLQRVLGGGSVDGGFDTPSNWSLGVPGLTDELRFNDNDAYTVDVDGVFTFDRFEQNGGTVTLNFNDPANDALIFTRGGAGGDRAIDIGSVNGATLNINNGKVYGQDRWKYGYLGRGLLEEGTINITGAEGYFGAQIAVGEYGQGTVNVSNGAYFDVGGATYLGYFASGKGTVNIDGVGSIFQNRGTGIIGSAGEGYFNITNGGYAQLNPTFGGDWTGYGQGLVSGEGSLLTTFTSYNSAYNSITVGGRGEGKLTVENGANAIAYTSLEVGEAYGLGRLFVDNATASGTSVIIGEYGHGQVNITNGGEVSGRNIIIGYRDPGQAVVNVDGVNSKLRAYTYGIDVGGFVGNGDAPGGLSLTNGGAASAVQNVNIHRNGHLSGNGTITAPNIINSGTVAPSMRYALDDNYSFTQTLDRSPFALAAVGGGSVRPKLTIDGNYQQTATGNLNIHFDQYGWDQLVVTGNTSLGGSLNLTAAEDYVLAPDAFYDVIKTGGNLTGSFAGLAEGDKVATLNGTDLFVTYNPLGGRGVSLFSLAAPEPPPSNEPITIETIDTFGEYSSGQKQSIFTNITDAFGSTQNNSVTLSGQFELLGNTWISSEATYDNFLGQREARAFAAITTDVGTNRVILETSTDAPDFTKPYATASSTWFDHIVVLGGEGEDELTIWFSLDGRMSQDEGNTLLFMLRATSLDENNEVDSTVNAAKLLTYADESLGEDGIFDERVEVTIPFTYGEAIRLDTTVFATAWLNGEIDFSGTAKIESVLLPDGATALSSAIQNGENAEAYNNMIDLYNVPEPSSLAIVALPALLLLRRRRDSIA